MIKFKRILPATSKRVLFHTNNCSNKKIAIKTIRNISKYKKAGKEAITARLKELDHEWDTERVLETNAASIVMLTSLLGYCKSRKWNFVTLLVGTFLLQHALLGWCPPLPIIRKLGIRTEDEINNEKVCLKYYHSKWK